MPSPSSGDEEESPTGEVGDEGGTPGDLEIEKRDRGTGREGDETWRPGQTRKRPVAHDETGTGRRSP
jgi:hypothetical protein